MVVVIPAFSDGSGSDSSTTHAKIFIAVFVPVFVIAVVLSILATLHQQAMQRIRCGQLPPKGTGWLVSSHKRQKLQQNYETAYMPDNGSARTVEVGYYDRYGNYTANIASIPPYDLESQGYPMSELNPRGVQSDQTHNTVAEFQNLGTDIYPPPAPPAPAKH